MLETSKTKKILFFNLFFAFFIIILYSPGFIGLSILKGNVALRIFSGVLIVLLVALFIFCNKSFLEMKQKKFVTKNQNGIQKAESYMKEYCASKYLGSIAQSAIIQNAKINKERINFERLVENRFSKDSLSYDKFMAVMETAEKTLKNGYMRIINKMIVFDEEEYELLVTGKYKYDEIPDEIQEEKYALYERNLAEMREILRKNEEALLQLNKLTLELSDFDISDEKMEYTVADIKELLQQLDYYKKA